MKIFQTAERVSAKELSDNYVYQRSLLAYKMAAQLIKGVVLEIGTGDGYGINEIGPYADSFITVDKFKCDHINQLPSNVLSIQMEVPKLYGIPDNSVDFVISFQVIEHIEQDYLLIQEINRVLKPGGKLIISTPNKLKSLTRNPWHVREYTTTEFERLLKNHFKNIDKKGVFGNEKINSYYHQNRLAVEKLKRFDIFNFMSILPRSILQIPYDIFNRLNRKKLLKENFTLCIDISLSDYFVKEADDDCFDLYYIAEKVA